MGKITINAEDARKKTNEAIKLQKEKEFQLISAFIAKMAGEGKYGIKVESLYKETKEALKALENLKACKKVLLVVDELTDNIILATRNIKEVVLLEASEINTYDVIAADNMIITEKAVKQIEEVLV